MGLEIEVSYWSKQMLLGILIFFLGSWNTLRVETEKRGKTPHSKIRRDLCV